MAVTYCLRSLRRLPPKLVCVIILLCHINDLVTTSLVTWCRVFDLATLGFGWDYSDDFGQCFIASIKVNYLRHSHIYAQTWLHKLYTSKPKGKLTYRQQKMLQDYHAHCLWNKNDYHSENQHYESSCQSSKIWLFSQTLQLLYTWFGSLARLVVSYHNTHTLQAINVISMIHFNFDIQQWALNNCF